MKPTPVSGRPAQGLADYCAIAIATGFGMGFAPIASGTFGSLIGIVLFWGVLLLHLPSHLHYGLMMVGSILIAYVGIWASTRLTDMKGLKDPKQAVVDEVAGQFITYAFLPLAPRPGLIILGFLFFRAFDIIKPYPIHKLEFHEGGLGVMADDVLAGLFAGISVYWLNLALIGLGYW